MRKHQKTFWEDPCSSCITTVHNTLDQGPLRTHTYFPLFFFSFFYRSTRPGPPSMFVLIDFCGVRSLRTAADRPAIHLEFKECLGRSVPFLFVLHRMTASSGALPCQKRGWQGKQSFHPSVTFPFQLSPNQCSRATVLTLYEVGFFFSLDCMLSSGFPTLGIPSN